MRSGVQVRASTQGSGPEVGLEFRFGLRFRVRVPSSVWSSAFGFGSRVRSRVQVRGSVQGSGPEFGLEFRFGVRFWVRVAPSSVLSSGSEFGSGFCGVRNGKFRV